MLSCPVGDSCTSVGVKSSTVVVREDEEDTDMALEHAGVDAAETPNVLRDCTY